MCRCAVGKNLLKNNKQLKLITSPIIFKGKIILFCKKKKEKMLKTKYFYKSFG